MNEADHQTLEQFAAYVRTESEFLMVALAMKVGATHPATRRAEQLCTQAGNILQGKRMQEELAAPGAYDLAALHVDADKPTNSENPFEDD